jgi:predicted nucleic acid-binding protein
VTAIHHYLIDRTALIDISKEIEPISSQIREWLEGPAEVGTCGAVVSEFFAGLRSNERLPWISFIDRLAFWEITRPIAIQAGVFRHYHARLGVALSTTDTLIAAVAVSVGATLVTRNIKDFPMNEVSVIRLGP